VHIAPLRPWTLTQTGQLTSNSNPLAWPADLLLTERFITNPHWPVKLQLDLDTGNWEEWSHCMCIIVQNQGFRHWLDGTFAQPDLSTSPGRHYMWQLNDDSLKAFLFHTISHTECKLIKDLPMANAVWNTLRIRHEKQGPYTQLMLIKQCLDIRFNLATPLNKTID